MKGVAVVMKRTTPATATATKTPLAGKAVPAMVKVGDHVEVASRRREQGPRRGVVVAITDSLLTIRWASGEESRFIPGPGYLRVVPAGKAAPAVVKVGDHVEVA